MTFQDILNAAYDDQGYQISGVVSPNPSADVIARFKRWANEAIRDLTGRPRLAALRHGTFTFTSVPGQTIYSVAEAFDAIDAVVQPTNDRRLRNMTRDWYRSIDPGERSQGTPWAWIEEGYSSVAQQPAAAAQLWAYSDSPSDTTQLASVQGITSDGYTQAIYSATLNGSTRVLLSPYSYQTVRSFYLSAPATGHVRLHDDPVAGALISGIIVGGTSAQYHLIRLWPTPSAAEPYVVDGQLKVRDLVSPTDVPFALPSLFHQLIVDWINIQAWTKNGDFARAQAARTSYERRIGDLTNKMEFSHDYRPVRGGLGPDTRRWTNLPSGWYPADGWGR